jgi:drug/metabolite transporter (DMT)-like permease
MLGIACSGVAYLLHFRLVADLGPAPALSVTFLIPVFGIFWGALFLSEAVDRHTVIGTAIILCGTALVTGFSWRSLRSVRVR